MSTNKSKLWIAVAGVLGMLGGMGISAGMLVAMPGVIASSGLIGEFNLTLEGGDTKTSFSFNPKTTSVEDLVRQGLSNKESARTLAYAISGTLKELPPDSELAALFREEFLASKRGPFHPSHHWLRDITSTDGVMDLVNIKKIMTTGNTAIPTRKYHELRSLILSKVRLGEGIFGSEAQTARFSFPAIRTEGEIKGRTAAVCQNSVLRDKPLLVSKGVIEAKAYVVEASGLIDKSACESWQGREGEQRVWIQLSHTVKQSLFGKHALSEETGYVEMLSDDTRSRRLLASSDGQ